MSTCRFSAGDRLRAAALSVDTGDEHGRSRLGLGVADPERVVGTRERPWVVSRSGMPVGVPAMVDPMIAGVAAEAS